jgi:hypothetical protein
MSEALGRGDTTPSPAAIEEIERIRDRFEAARRDRPRPRSKTS